MQDDLKKWYIFISVRRMVLQHVLYDSISLAAA